MQRASTSLLIASLLTAACGDDATGTGGGTTSTVAAGTNVTTTAQTASASASVTASASTGMTAIDSCDDADPVGPPCVEVPATGPYGTRTFSVPAAAHWVNTGLFVTAGTDVQITATGTWTGGGTSAPGETGPEGHPGQQQRGCNVGSLTARVGLGYDDMDIECVGEGTTLTATTSGILYLGAIIDTDLGDTYGVRLPNAGALTVTVTSDGATVPTVFVDDAATFDFSSVTSGWVELRADHVTITAPAAIAQQDRATIAPALAVFDAIYEKQTELRGATPYRGERIRFYPDASIDGIGYMLAGNPVRMMPVIFENPAPGERLLASNDVAHGVWGFAHEMGHVFSFVNGTWHYQQDTLEAWCNIFTVYALRGLMRPDPGFGNDATYPSAGFCPDRAAYLASGAYDPDFKSDPFLQLCFFLTFEERYGFTMYSEIFTTLNTIPWQEIPTSPPSAVWGWVRDEMSSAAGEDVTPIFQEWKIPLP